MSVLQKHGSHSLAVFRVNTSANVLGNLQWMGVCISEQ
jgi:hypothetical protein